jgi:transposase
MASRRDTQLTLRSKRRANSSASQRRTALLALYPQLRKSIEDLDKQASEQASQRPQAHRLMTHPAVGPITALATEVFLGDPKRFADGKAVASCQSPYRSRKKRSGDWKS